MNFLYNQRRRLWRRQTCPRTSRPVIVRLGMMTVHKCQAVVAAGSWRNPRVKLMAIIVASGLIDRPVKAGVACNKVPDVFGYWYAIDIAAGFNIFGYLVGNILDPVLKCVEGHDANRSVELAG